MVLYTCRRCGYSNKIKTHMKKHFMRQTLCSPSNENIPISVCYEEIFGNKKGDVTLCNPRRNPNVTQVYLQSLIRMIPS